MNESEVISIAERLVNEYLVGHKAIIDGTVVELACSGKATIFPAKIHTRYTTPIIYQDGDTIPLYGEVRLTVVVELDGLTSEGSMYNLEVQIQLGEQPTLVGPPMFNPR